MAPITLPVVELDEAGYPVEACTPWYTPDVWATKDGSNGKPVPKDWERRYRFGPKFPDFVKVMKWAHKEEKEVAHAMGLSETEFSDFIDGRMPKVLKWGPALARCTMECHRAMVRLLSKASPWEKEGWGTQTATGEWKISYLSTVGETIFESIKKEEGNRFSYELPQGSIASCSDFLTKGWERWDGYQLSENEVSEFFSGTHKEAEEIAQLLLKFAQATDPQNIFSAFLT